MECPFSRSCRKLAPCTSSTPAIPNYEEGVGMCNAASAPLFIIIYASSLSLGVWAYRLFLPLFRSVSFCTPSHVRLISVSHPSHVRLISSSCPFHTRPVSLVRLLLAYIVTEPTFYSIPDPVLRGRTPVASLPMLSKGSPLARARCCADLMVTLISRDGIRWSQNLS